MNNLRSFSVIKKHKKLPRVELNYANGIKAILPELHV